MVLLTSSVIPALSYCSIRAQMMKKGILITTNTMNSEQQEMDLFFFFEVQIKIGEYDDNGYEKIRFL